MTEPIDQRSRLKPPNEPMRYRRDVPRGLDNQVMNEVIEEVREHLATVADADDDPNTHADDVEVVVLDHLDGDPSQWSILGTLDAEPDAPYLRDDYDPGTDDDGTRFTRYSEEGQE